MVRVYALGGLGWALYLLGEGSMYIPRLTILGLEFNPYQFNSVFYDVIVAAFIVTVLLLWRVNRSPFGNALRAIRDNEIRAAFIGIPVWQYRWYAFILSGFFVGLAGGLYGQLARQITRSNFTGFSPRNWFWRSYWAARDISWGQSWARSRSWYLMNSRRDGRRATLGVRSFAHRRRLRISTRHCWPNHHVDEHGSEPSAHCTNVRFWHLADMG